MALSLLVVEWLFVWSSVFKMSSGTWLYGRVDDDFSSTASGSFRDVLGEGILDRSMTLP